MRRGEERKGKERRGEERRGEKRREEKRREEKRREEKGGQRIMKDCSNKNKKTGMIMIIKVIPLYLYVR